MASFIQNNLNKVLGSIPIASAASRYTGEQKKQVKQQTQAYTEREIELENQVIQYSELLAEAGADPDQLANNTGNANVHFQDLLTNEQLAQRSLQRAGRRAEDLNALRERLVSEGLIEGGRRF